MEQAQSLQSPWITNKNQLTQRLSNTSPYRQNEKIREQKREDPINLRGSGEAGIEDVDGSGEKKQLIGFRQGPDQI